VLLIIFLLPRLMIPHARQWVFTMQQPVGTMQRKHVPIPVGTSYLEQKNYLASLLISNLDHVDRFGFLCYCWYCNSIKGDYNHKTFFLWKWYPIQNNQFSPSRYQATKTCKYNVHTYKSFMGSTNLEYFRWITEYFCCIITEYFRSEIEYIFLINNGIS
jgi:hypothetical protein